MCVLCCQSVKVLTYLEPQNPEYHQFVETLKSDAQKMFNFTIKDSLVPNTLTVILLLVDLRFVLLRDFWNLELTKH